MEVTGDQKHPLVLPGAEGQWIPCSTCLCSRTVADDSTILEGRRWQWLVGVGRAVAAQLYGTNLTTVHIYWFYCIGFTCFVWTPRSTLMGLRCLVWLLAAGMSWTVHCALLVVLTFGLGPSLVPHTSLSVMLSGGLCTLEPVMLCDMDWALAIIASFPVESNHYTRFSDIWCKCYPMQAPCNWQQR